MRGAVNTPSRKMIQNDHAPPILQNKLLHVTSPLKLGDARGIDLYDIWGISKMLCQKSKLFRSNDF